MSWFSRLFCGEMRTKSKQNRDSSATHSDHDDSSRALPREDYETLESTRSWMYVAERGEKDNWYPNGNQYIDYSVANACRIRAERYLQKPLSAIEGDTIALNVAHIANVKDSRGLTWHEDGQFAVVDDAGRLYGMIYDFDAERYELEPGDRIKVAVSRRPWTAEYVVLWSLGKINTPNR